MHEFKRAHGVFMLIPHLANLANFLASIQNCICEGNCIQLKSDLLAWNENGFIPSQFSSKQVDEIIDHIELLAGDHYLYLEPLLQAGLPLDKAQVLHLFNFGVTVNDTCMLDALMTLPIATSIRWEELKPDPYSLCRTLAIAEHLYKHGCPLESPIPLMNWVIFGNADIVKRFLKEGHIINSIFQTRTLLEIAVEAGHPDTVQVLLESGHFSAVQRTSTGEMLESIIGGLERDRVEAILARFRFDMLWTKIRVFVLFVRDQPELMDPFMLLIVPSLASLL